MTKTFILFFLIFFEGLILKGQVVIRPTSNHTTKKIDQKIDVISNIPNAAILGFYG